VAVNSTFTLPNQPAAGNATWFPLGGDGWISPKAALSVEQQLTMDASGGIASCACFMDPRFESIVVQAQAVVTGVAANAEFQMFLIQNQPATGNRVRAFGTGLRMATIDNDCLFSWAPPLVGDQNRIVVQADNVNGGVLEFQLWIFLFNIRVFEKVPLSTILSSIPSITGQNVVA